MFIACIYYYVNRITWYTLSTHIVFFFQTNKKRKMYVIARRTLTLLYCYVDIPMKKIMFYNDYNIMMIAFMPHVRKWRNTVYFIIIISICSYRSKVLPMILILYFPLYTFIISIKRYFFFPPREHNDVFYCFKPKTFVFY